MPQAKHLNITQVTSFQLFSWSSSSRSPSPPPPPPPQSSPSSVSSTPTPLSCNFLPNLLLLLFLQHQLHFLLRQLQSLCYLCAPFLAGSSHLVADLYGPRPQHHNGNKWRWWKPSLLLLGRGWKPSSLLLLGRGLLPKPPGHNTALQGQVHPVIVIIIAINTREHFKYYLANFLPFLIWFWGTMPPHPPHSASVGRHTLWNLEFSENFTSKDWKWLKKGH